MKVILATGGFDPVHSGHVEYLSAARALGDKLVVGLNSDYWLKRKKGRSFMPWGERARILEALKPVDHVLEFNDNDGTACEAISRVVDIFGNCVFVNGGDRTSENIPEQDKFVDDSRVEFAFGVGSEIKKNSSSWILEEWRAPKTLRDWGYYRVLHEVAEHVKLKELTVEPGRSLSMQRHQDRNEYWFVAEGEATVYTLNPSTDVELLGKFFKHESLDIYNKQWHMLVNETQEPLKIIEIQYGERCVEDDIERKYYDKS